MKLQINEDQQEATGEYPAAFVSGSDATPQKIFDALWNKFGGDGYKFAIVFDTSHDEYEVPSSRTSIYFLDSLFREYLDYVGKNNVLQELKERGWI